MTAEPRVGVGRVRVEFGSWAAALARLGAIEAGTAPEACEQAVCEEVVAAAARVLEAPAAALFGPDGRTVARSAGVEVTGPDAPATVNGSAPPHDVPVTTAVDLATPAGELIGRLAVYGVPAEQSARLELLATYVGEAGEIVERVRLREASDELAAREHRRASLHRRLADAALRLTAAQTLDEVLRLVTEAAQDIVGSHQAVTSRLRHGWKDASTHVSLSEKYAAWRSFDEVPKGLGVLNAVTRENRPLRLTGDELRRHPEFRALRDAPGHPPLPDYLAAPLIARDGSNLGLVQLSDKASGEPFSAEDEAMLVQLAQLASSVIEGLEARERAERRDRHARALEQVGRAIASRLELDQIVQLATDAATGLTGARFGAFFYNTVDEGGEQLVLYTLSGAPREAFEHFGLPRKTAIFQPTFDGEAIVRLDDVTADPRYGRNPPNEGMPEGHLPVRSYLAVPVVTSDGEVAGGLFFGHPEPGRFDEEAETVAAGIAAQAAVGLVNARLYDAAQQQLRARQRAFEDRDQVARVLQRSLLPPTIPQIPGLRVAARYRAGDETVGGDFYDVFPLGSGVWGLVLGDVCGRGAEAAARTALTRHAVRTAAILESEPSAVLGIANEALLRDGTDRFTTAVFARVAPSRRGTTVTFSAGGHPPALVLAADGGVERLDVPGTLLGVTDHVELRDSTVALDDGETIVFYTDGLTEARRGADIFGEERLVEALAACAGDGPEAIAERLLAVTDAFADGRHTDDVAIVVVQVDS